MDIDLRSGMAGLTRPLKVLIIGGGIGGQAAAVFLRRAGHIVEIFESSRFGSETGAAIHIPSNVNGLLRRMGMVPEAHGATQAEWISVYKPDGEQVVHRDLRGLSMVYPYPWQLIHRVDLHNALKDLATCEDNGKGRPATLHLRSKVASVDSINTTITLENGSVYSGDLIIAADGIHSKIRTQLVMDMLPPSPSGSNAFRFLIPASTIRANAETAHFVERQGEMMLLYGTDRRIVIYPCRYNSLLNFVAIHPSEETDTTSEKWNQTATKERLLSCYETYSQNVRDLLSLVEPDGINLWSLLDHAEMGRHNWVHGKVVLIGDAAHGFLPHQGQGGAQAVEDAAALGALFPYGTRVEDIETRLKLYIEARYDRATTVQDVTRQAASRSPENGFIAKETMEYNMNHDAYNHASGILLRHAYSQSIHPRMPTPDKCFVDLYQPSEDHTPFISSYQTMYMTFQTTKSCLSSLLPTIALEITTPGAWATATLAHTKYTNENGGTSSSHELLGLYIHNVSVVVDSNDLVTTNDCITPSSTNKEPLVGDFLPLFIQSIPNDETTQPSETDLAKVFVTFESRFSHSDTGSSCLRATCNGPEFLTFKLENLERCPDSGIDEEVSNDSTTPLLHYSRRTSSDSNHISTSPNLPSVKGKTQFYTHNATISFVNLEDAELWEKFPTLASTIKALREIEVMEVLHAGIKDGLKIFETFSFLRVFRVSFFGAGHNIDLSF